MTRGRASFWSGIVLEGRALVRLAGPLIVSNLAWTGMAAIDLVLVGRLGESALAATALALSLYSFCLVAGTGLVLAAAPVLAADRTRAPRNIAPVAKQTLWLVLLLCPFCWLLLGAAEPILLALGQPLLLADQAQQLLTGLQWALLPQLAFLALRNVITALERPRWAMIASFAVLPVNFVLGYGLIFGLGSVPPLGLFGAGLASTLAASFMLALLCLAISFDAALARHSLLGGSWRLQPRIITGLARLGMPIAATLVIEIGTFNIAALIIGRSAPGWLAAHAVAAQVVSLMFMVPMGLAQAASVRVGLAYGEADHRAISLTGRAAITLALTYTVVGAILLLLLRDPLAALFIGDAGPDYRVAREAASLLLILVAAFQLADNLQGVLAGLLRGLQDSLTPMFLAIIGFWAVGLVSAALLVNVVGAPGVWLGLALGLTTTASLYAWRWRQLRKAPGAALIAKRLKRGQGGCSP